MKSKTQEIYVHIPFCERKCDYCDFVSFVSDDDKKRAYFSMLKRQIMMKSESAGNIPVDSVFFGGGTPSCVDASLVGETMDCLGRYFDITKDAEISIEMNPNSVSKGKLAVYKQSGINRVSIGLQSANNRELQLLSRLHSYEEFLDAFSLARDAGFANINVDLMSGLPGQSPDLFVRSLEKVTDLEPEHISVYSLIIEEGTAFYDRYSRADSLLDEETDREIYHLTRRYLESKGYGRYEISNYSKPGYECKHNIGYWTRKEYLGLGISAASLKDNIRYSMHTDIGRYLMGDFSEEKEILSKEDEMSEYMFLGLRMIKGISRREFFEEFGVLLESVYGRELDKLKKQGLLEEKERIMLTEKGLDLANVAMAEFV